MRRAVLAIIVSLGVSACSSGLFSSSPSAPQNPPIEEPDSRRPTPPRDNRTRAKLHTELGALYLQNQNLSVALEELTMAIVIDPDYAEAHGTRGLVLYHIREMEPADRCPTHVAGDPPTTGVFEQDPVASPRKLQPTG